MIGTREDAVTIQVELEGHKVAALLDTEAKPSVIDHSTLLNLGLEHEMVTEAGKVLGLGEGPREILGYTDAKVQVGSHPIVTQRIQVLEADNPTFILQRTLLSQFREIAYEFNRGRVRLGRDWEPV